MRKQLSVLGLIARSSVYKVLGIIVLMCLAEFGLFALEFAGKVSAEFVSGFQFYIEQSNIDICLAIVFVLITLVLCLTGTEYSSMVGYTLQRLSISEKAVFYYQTAYNTVIYFLLWAVQIALIYAFGIWYSNTVSSEFANNLSIFLSSYRSDFLHSLLPLSDITLWIRNFLLIISLGIASAEFPYIQRRKKYSVFIVFVVVFVLFFFVTGIGTIENFVFSVLLFVIVIIMAFYDIYHKEDSYDK